MATEATEIRLYSIGEVAKTAGVTRDQAVYAAQSFGVEPTVVAGGRRLYDEHAADRIRSALLRIQTNRRERRRE